MSSPESIVMKQPIRRLEIQINNFNVAIPHHVDLLKRHKSNIQKYRAQHDWEKIHKEHLNVTRIIKQLKELLYQMDTLRAQVLDSDINQFDKLTAKARTSIINTVQEYMEMQLNLSMSQPESSVQEDQRESHPLHERDIQLQEEYQELHHQEACMHAWSTLQGDMHQLHQLFVNFNKIVEDQKEQVNTVEDHIEETDMNVKTGEQFLRKAARYKAVMYPLTGAVLGTCIGGPIGLIAGLKIGGLAAIGCGVLGFTGGSILKKQKENEMQNSNSKVRQDSTRLKSIEKWTNLPEESNESKKEL